LRKHSISLCPDTGVFHLGRAPGHAKLVVHFYWRVGVQRVATVVPQIGTLGRGDDKHVMSIRSDDRTEGIHARPSVLSDCSQKPQAHAELVEKSLAFVG
jgi:hypothetical protein